jgi:hypothetical protein
MSAPEPRRGPGIVRIAARLTAVGLAAALVVAPTYWWLGPATTTRLYGRDEFARFRPTVGHGLGQFVGETLLSLLLIWAARRWLRLRL